VLTIEIESERMTEVFTGFGEKRVKAETVAERECGEAEAYLESGAPVGEHLADQLLIPCALAGGGSFVASAFSRHASTNIEVIRMFLGIRFARDSAGAGTRISACPA
jgi:RNA 3'-terminal phosphate cyclase (ATP)